MPVFTELLFFAVPLNLFKIAPLTKLKKFDRIVPLSKQLR